MLLVITFPNETIPFIEDELSEEEVIRIIGKAKEIGWTFQQNCIVEPDRVVLHAMKEISREISRRKKKRYYILDEKVILVTPDDSPDEILPTKHLLAYEKGVSISQITAISI